MTHLTVEADISYDLWRFGWDPEISDWDPKLHSNYMEPWPTILGFNKTLRKYNNSSSGSSGSNSSSTTARRQEEREPSNINTDLV